MFSPIDLLLIGCDLQFICLFVKFNTILHAMKYVQTVIKNHHAFLYDHKSFKNFIILFFIRQLPPYFYSMPPNRSQGYDRPGRGGG